MCGSVDSEPAGRPVVFMLFGQSNAVGHALPMAEADRITQSLRNVFGLSRDFNQSLSLRELRWSGYTSAGMNLGETQDHTYSLANCLARRWQDAIDSGDRLPDLYIIHIAIGAQGVTEQFMWYPDRPPKLVPGPLGTADISLTPFAVHILSLLRSDPVLAGRDPYFVLHWRGGEEEDGIPDDLLRPILRSIYDRLFDCFYAGLGRRFPIVIHRFCYDNEGFADNPGWEDLSGVAFINSVFQRLSEDNGNVSIFDARSLPSFDSSVRYHGLYIDDGVHYSAKVNNEAAAAIMRGLCGLRCQEPVV